MVLSDKAVARLKARTLQGTTNAFLRRNKLQTYHAEVRARQAQKEGKNEIPSLHKKDLTVVGAALYWAEEYKRLQVRDGKERMSHVISFVNSDAEMIRIFIKFLKEAMNIVPDRIVLTMRLYAHINEEAAYRYWMGITRLPKSQFRKTTYLVSGASKGKRPFNQLPWGTLQVQVCDTRKFHYLIGLIYGVKERL